MPAEGTLLPAEVKADIQGFVTSSWGHLPAAAYLFLRVTEPVGARRWLRRLLPEITTARPWRLGDGPKRKPRRALNVAMSAPGLEALGLTESALCSFPDAFREGMAGGRRSRILGDSEHSAPEHWQVGGPSCPVHLLLILKAAGEAERELWVEGIRRSLADGGGLEEIAGTRQDGEHPVTGTEPFGFRDGLSQPAVRGVHRKGEATGSFLLGYENHFGLVAPGPVVAPEDDAGQVLPASPNPHHRARGLKDLGRNGTFLVYRKLRQDVAGFWSFLRRESGRGGRRPDPLEMVWLAAKMVGRWPSGAPLTLAPERDDPSLASADFLYADRDPEGRGCPFGAHIRRSNPRDMLRPNKPRQSLGISAVHRILRRATVFGPPLFDHRILSQLDDPGPLRRLLDLEDDGEPRGLHFFAINANLESQFELIQQNWCNNPSFNGVVDGKDPLVGDNDRPREPPSRLHIPGRPGAPHTAPVPRFVTVEGGGYFFLPSLTALAYLGSDQDRRQTATRGLEV